MLHTSCVLGVCSCWPGPGAMSPAAGSGERAGKGRQQCLNDGAVPLGNCSRVLQPTCPSFRRRLASWTCCDTSWTICTSACCSTTAAWAAASPRRRGRALMRFPTQFPSPRVLFSRVDCPIWMVAFFFLSTHLRTTSTSTTEISTSRWRMGIGFGMLGLAIDNQTQNNREPLFKKLGSAHVAPC